MHTLLLDPILDVMCHLSLLIFLSICIKYFDHSRYFNVLKNNTHPGIIINIILLFCIHTSFRY